MELPAPRINYAAQAGGLVAFVAHLGAIRALRQAGYIIDLAAGTSGGALALAVAAGGADDEEIVSGLRELDFGSFQDPVHWYGRVKAGRVMDDIFFGAPYKGEELERQIAAFLESSGIHDFHDLERTIANGNTRAFRFFTIAADLNCWREIRLPDDLASLGISDPKSLPVARAARISAAMPTVFRPYPIVDRQRQVHWLIDGGAIDDWPYDILRRSNPDVRTIGARCFPQDPYRSMRETAPLGKRIPFGPRLFFNALRTGANGRNNELLQHPEVQHDTIFLPTRGYDALNLEQSGRDLEPLYWAAYDATRRWIARDLQRQTKAPDAGGRELGDAA